MKRSFVTGAAGQAGSYLVEHLLEQGHQVYAMVRRNTQFSLQKSYLKEASKNPNFHLVHGDVTDPFSLESLMEQIHPMYFFNAAAQSHVGESWKYPIHTVDATAKGVLHCLEVISKVVPSCRFLQFSTSELFGKVQREIQNEETPFYPRSPYGVSKLFGHWMTINYRESFGLFACNAIFFNMESPRRGEDFVTQKIIRNAKRIKSSLEEANYNEEKDCLHLGNVDSLRDWNWTPYIMEHALKILQLREPEDFVFGSGKNHSVREFLLTVFSKLGMPLEERDNHDFYWNDIRLVNVNPNLFRPAEVPTLICDASKAKQKLGFQPDKYPLESIIDNMLNA